MTFTNKFIAIYGMRPKQWLDEQLKTAIIDMARDEGTTPTLIAKELDMPPQRLNDFTTAYGACLPAKPCAEQERASCPYER